MNPPRRLIAYALSAWHEPSAKQTNVQRLEEAKDRNTFYPKLNTMKQTYL